MKVTLDPSQNALNLEPSPAPSAKAPAAHQPGTSAAATDTNGVAKQVALVAPQQPSVTFRKDPAGKIFYVVTDPQSGKEIREVPSDAVRKAGESIDDFLKRAEARQNSHVEVKA